MWHMFREDRERAAGFSCCLFLSFFLSSIVFFLLSFFIHRSFICHNSIESFLILCSLFIFFFLPYIFVFLSYISFQHLFLLSFIHSFFFVSVLPSFLPSFLSPFLPSIRSVSFWFSVCLFLCCCCLPIIYPFFLRRVHSLKWSGVTDTWLERMIKCEQADGGFFEKLE